VNFPGILEEQLRRTVEEITRLTAISRVLRKRGVTEEILNSVQRQLLIHYKKYEGLSHRQSGDCVKSSQLEMCANQVIVDLL
jgi:hypothetical protein